MHSAHPRALPVGPSHRRAVPAHLEGASHPLGSAPGPTPTAPARPSEGRASDGATLRGCGKAGGAERLPSPCPDAPGRGDVLPIHGRVSPAESGRIGRSPGETFCWIIPIFRRLRQCVRLPRASPSGAGTSASCPSSGASQIPSPTIGGDLSAYLAQGVLAPATTTSLQEWFPRVRARSFG